MSTQTVRRDLVELEGGGLVERVRGGAVAAIAEVPEAVDQRARNPGEKRRIGAAAAQRVTGGTVVFLGGGATTEAMAPFLDGVRAVTVVTNALNVAAALARLPALEVVVVSGYLRHAALTLHGHLAEQTVDEFRFDQAFFGCFGVDPEGDVTDESLPEAHLNRHVLARSARLVVLADHTKFTRRGPVRLAALDDVDTLVTDAGARARRAAPGARARRGGPGGLGSGDGLDRTAHGPRARRRQRPARARHPARARARARDRRRGGPPPPGLRSYSPRRASRGARPWKRRKAFANWAGWR